MSTTLIIIISIIIGGVGIWIFFRYKTAPSIDDQDEREDEMRHYGYRYPLKIHDMDDTEKYHHI